LKHSFLKSAASAVLSYFFSIFLNRFHKLTLFSGYSQQKGARKAQETPFIINSEPFFNENPRKTRKKEEKR
jgi:hypothetical protein